MTTRPPTDEELHAYADGQLDAARRSEIRAHLADDAAAAQSVEQIRRQTEALRRQLAEAGGDAIPERLDPACIRRRLRLRARRRMALAATMVLALGVGSLAGWQAHESAMRSNFLPMADAVHAYRMFASDSANTRVDFQSSQPAELQAWLNRHFMQPAPLPDFSAYGYQPMGARLMSTESGPAAIVLYRDQKGESILYYMRSPGRALNFGDGKRLEGNLMAQYWKQGRYVYAVVSPRDTPAARAVQQAVAPGA